jgi:tetratricopeptide (TPR) repeat protein
MFAQCMRTLTLLAALPLAAVAGQPPQPIDVYRSAVAVYVKTGDATRAVEPLLGWSHEELNAVVKVIVRHNDPVELEAAALLHLEIGISVVGLSLGGAIAYFDQGSRLIDTVLPPAAIRRGLSALRLEEIASLRATWHRVAASAFLSVNDIQRARPLVLRAQQIDPKSAATLTLAGTTDEIDAGLNDPAVWDALSQRTRVARAQAFLLLRAERTYEAALEADPSYALALIRLGRVQHLQKNLRKARESLERGAAAAKEPRHQFLAAMFTGALQQSVNDFPGAIRSFERALAIAPRSQNAVVGLAFAEMMAGRTEQARKVAQAFTGARQADDAWWAYKTGALDFEGLQWLRQRVRK